jgi:hypothetical protein
MTDPELPPNTLFSLSGQGCGSPFLASYCCTLREQFGYRYAITVWLFWNKIDVIDSYFPLFPYLLIYRTEEAAGSNPSSPSKYPMK